jgi:hypothetical protein
MVCSSLEPRRQAPVLLAFGAVPCGGLRAKAERWVRTKAVQGVRPRCRGPRKPHGGGSALLGPPAARLESHSRRLKRSRTVKYPCTSVQGPRLGILPACTASTIQASVAGHSFAAPSRKTPTIVPHALAPISAKLENTSFRVAMMELMSVRHQF